MGRRGLKEKRNGTRRRKGDKNQRELRKIKGEAEREKKKKKIRPG